MGIDLVELWGNMSIIVKIITVMMIGMSVFMFYVITERLLTFSAASRDLISASLAAFTPGSKLYCALACGVQTMWVMPSAAASRAIAMDVSMLLAPSSRPRITRSNSKWMKVAVGFARLWRLR